MTLANGRQIVPGIISPLSPTLQTKRCYVKAFGEGTVQLESLGFLADATAEFKEVAALQRLTAATLVCDPASSSVGDCFVLRDSPCSAVRTRLLLSSWNPKLVNNWFPVICDAPSRVSGWVRAISQTDAEGLFLGELADLVMKPPIRLTFLFDTAITACIADLEVTANWSNSCCSGSLWVPKTPSGIGNMAD
jgi:hypothetical protein